MARSKSQTKKSKTPKSKKNNKKNDVEEEETNMDVGIVDDSTKEEEVGEKITLAALDAISDEEGDDEENDENAEWNAEARALRQAIAEGAFDNIVRKSKQQPQKEKNQEKNIQLDDNSSSEEKAEEKETDDGNEDNDGNEEEKEKQKISIKALQNVTLELTTENAGLPWAERFDVTPPTPLPFGEKTEDGVVIQVHDDLKREVAFYNLALEAVHIARGKCEENKIPFSRPEDFFAEMVKTDDHMAKVKDRLIFETKKMDSFDQRKSNREHKLRAKEAHAHRLSEKAKSKKRHMQDVDDWAKSAASNRAGNNMVRDNDDEYLSRMNEGGPNKKRTAMDKRYGHGGKNGRFKQNDRKSMNDMSGYNPKGNFSGGKKGSTGGTKRKGKRARDAAKARG